MKIAGIECGELVLAPMAGVNCEAFRQMCKAYGADLIYTQMINVTDLDQAVERFIGDIDDKPRVVQLVGSDINLLEEAARLVTPHADIIDINFGCCESPILSKKGGAFLMKHPEQMNKIIEAIQKGTNLPITAKIRSGWDKVNAPDVARRLERLGVAAIAVHPRTRKQGYRGKAAWNVIKEVKKSVKIPIIGNGDVKEPVSARLMKEITNCDAIMIGRAAMGDPAVFERIKYRIQKRPTVEDKKKIALEFISLYTKQKRQRFPELSQHLEWIFKGTPRAKTIKYKISQCTEETIKECITNIRTT